MRKERIITGTVMCIVSIMVLVGFTVAWYTLSGDAALNGLTLTAAEPGDIRIALFSKNDTTPESEGKRGVDISNLTGDDRYVAIGLEKLKNIGFKEMDAEGNPVTVYRIAPGTYGDVTFYITPLKSSVTACQISAETILKAADGTAFTSENGEITLPDGGSTVNVYKLAQEHIVFYYYPEAADGKVSATPVYIRADADGTNPEEAARALIPLKWDAAANEGIEKEVRLYWKWHYESPEFEKELADKSAGESEADAKKIELKLRQQPAWRTRIEDYDQEDTLIGNYIRNMQFYFKFFTA